MISDEPEVSGHRPSIDVTFLSAKVYQSAAVGIIMTGMGRDGVDGCKAILTAGGFTLGQDEATSVEDRKGIRAEWHEVKGLVQ